ncbi:uncharacterized protein LOC111272530 isoform X2 [Varroa jacobsoni]|uniref:Calponin-homology (CH) domain-containing protein n=1 Tax=Varroa destructor TaxID=109461 RepID=A0A7M7JM31_VARDE|nr:uncharacterized protein LOC111247049 isoform X2 [Varroa destructor]XP_022653317.1 uncharacterized protein LOC111247049 isoform X2 [Varroa destructor]XP_022709765.1 uncharacterized protein LOC111272530 isoform X2 [Varroa jacobsoni]
MDTDLVLLLDLLTLLRNYMLTVVENYRAMFVSRTRTFFEWLLKACLHPASVCSLRDIQEWLFVWKCYFTNLLSFNTAEKNEKLLEWVRLRVGPKLQASDFGASWRSGILLCALVESIAPGSCPRYDLLNEDNRFGNAQLAVQLIEKINLRPCLTAQELSNDNADIEKPLKALLAQFRMAAAKRKLRSAVKSPGDEKFLGGQGGELFAKGMGLIFAVKGRKASFNIFRRGQGAFSFVIEIQGPEGTLGSALITHKSVARNPGSLTPATPTNSSPSGLKRQLSTESKTIVIDYVITNEKISVTYTPVTSGKHTLNIVAQGQHILRSPYDISVDCNTAEVTAKVVETLFRPKISALQRLGRRFSGTNLMASQKASESSVGIPFPHAEVTGKVVAKRVIKRTILGSNIVIHGDNEQELVRALKDISNLNPKNRERLQQRRPMAPLPFVLRPVGELRNPHTNKVRTGLDRSISEWSEHSSADDSLPAVAHTSPIFIMPPRSGDVAAHEAALDRIQVNQRLISDENSADVKARRNRIINRFDGRSGSNGNSISLSHTKAVIPSLGSLAQTQKTSASIFSEDEANSERWLKRIEGIDAVGAVRQKKGYVNNNAKMDVVHDHGFLIRKKNITLDIVSESRYVSDKKGADRDSSKLGMGDSTVEKMDSVATMQAVMTTAVPLSNSTSNKTGSCLAQESTESLNERCREAERRVLCQADWRNMRLKSEWHSTPETVLVRTSDESKSKSIDQKQRQDGPFDEQREVDQDSRSELTDSREVHVGSESDEIEDRMNEIDGEVRQMAVSSMLNKFTHFSPAASPDNSTSGSSSNCSDLASPVRSSPSMFGMPPTKSYHHLHGY